jgi:thioredoxin 2
MAEPNPTRKVTLRCPACQSLNRVDLSRLQSGPKCGHCQRALPLGGAVPLAEADFERVIGDAEVPVLVDFYADWCGPCKIMAPVMEELARARAGEVLIAKVDADRAPNLSARFGIRGIPTLIAFRGGREVAREVGAQPRPRLEAMVNTALAASA